MTESTGFYSELQDIINGSGPEQQQHAEELTGIAQAMLEHFFFDPSSTLIHPIPKVYGQRTQDYIDSLPGYWSFVRFLVEDRLCPQWGGKTKFADVEWTDKFLADISTEAAELRTMLPDHVSNEDWIFLVRVASLMVREDQSLKQRGVVTEQGRYNFENQAFQASMAFQDTEIDYYEATLSGYLGKYSRGGKRSRTND